jgi:hypothetical protein
MKGAPRLRAAGLWVLSVWGLKLRSFIHGSATVPLMKCTNVSVFAQTLVGDTWFFSPPLTHTRERVTAVLPLRQ